MGWQTLEPTGPPNRRRTIRQPRRRTRRCATGRSPEMRDCGTRHRRARLCPPYARPRPPIAALSFPDSVQVRWCSSCRSTWCSAPLRGHWSSGWLCGARNGVPAGQLFDQPAQQRGDRQAHIKAGECGATPRRLFNHSRGCRRRVAPNHAPGITGSVEPVQETTSSETTEDAAPLRI